VKEELMIYFDENTNEAVYVGTGSDDEEIAKIKKALGKTGGSSYSVRIPLPKKEE